MWNGYLELLYEETGQDLVEYTLLIAWVAIVAVIVLNYNSEPIRDIMNRTSHWLGEGSTR